MKDRCTSYIFCADCNRTHRCIYKSHDPQAQHYWDNQRNVGHTFAWCTGKTKELKVLGNVFLWLSQGEIEITLRALDALEVLTGYGEKNSDKIMTIVEKLRAQKRSPELLALAKKAVKMMARRKDTPLARKRWAHRLAKSASKLND